MSTLDQGTSIPISLQEMKVRFEHWRSTRVKRGKIPNALWQQVIFLTRKHSIYELSKVLRLNGTDIKSKMQLGASHPLTPHTKSSTYQSSFLEINIPLIEEDEVHLTTGKIELKRPDGATVLIEHLDKRIVMQILTQFMEGLKC